MTQVFEGYRFIDVTVPAGTDAVTDPIETRDVFERPTMVFAPAGWQTSHIDAEASPDGSTWVRIWSSDVTATHFVISLGASQAMVFQSSFHRGAFRYFRFHIITDQLVSRTITVLFGDSHCIDARAFRAKRITKADSVAKDGGKA